MRTFTFKGLFLTAVFMLLGCLSIQAADDDLITRQITIKLDKAGTLPDKIGSSKKNLITKLKIVGEVNGTDWCFIREMAGSGYDGKSTEGKLSVLDLSEAKIVEGGDYYNKYYYYENDVYYYKNCYTSNDVIGKCAFKGCSGLTSLTLPDGITEIGSSAFFGCSGLTSLTIPDGVTKIGKYAFSNCSYLTSLTIPSSVNSLGDYAFKNCSSLQSVHVSWSTPISVGKAFNKADVSKCTLYVPQGTEQDYFLADVWGDFGNIVEYDPTGIDKVTTSTDAKELSRYSVNGQRLATPTKGLNIVKYSDGSVKKVVVQ